VCVQCRHTADDGTEDLSETYRVLYQINLRNSASRWLLLQEYITMHGPLNVTFFILSLCKVSTSVIVLDFSHISCL
jgi:hypothetical protein